MRSDKEREAVRQTAYQIMEEMVDGKKKLLVCSDEISGKTGIDQLRVGLFLSSNYQKWGLERTNISPYHLQNIWAYFKKTENNSVGVDTLMVVDALKEKLVRERKERKLAKEREIAEKRANEKALMKSEDLSQRIQRMIDDLHKNQGKVNFTDIRLKLRIEIGKIPDSDTVALALDIYEKDIERKRYIWNFEEGYSTMPV
jgi:hypothetical protein